MTGNEIQKVENVTMRKYLGSDKIKLMFSEIMGKRAGAFINSIANLYRLSPALHKCNEDSIINATVIAATLNLPIEPALGQAAIVPYKGQAQFQIMYKGLVQLCIRSNQYKTIYCSEIYSDELKSYNPITGKIAFHEDCKYEMRAKADDKNVIGHYAAFELISGFEKSDYMTCQEALAHARKYSRAYQYDLKEKKAVSPWSTMPIAMGNKTVLKRLLSKYGVMSIEMQDVFAKEDSFEETDADMRKTVEAQQGSQPIDADFENGKEDLPEPQQAEEKPVKTKKKTKAKGGKKGPLYVCKPKGHKFDKPTISGSGTNQVEICPECLTADIIRTDDKPAFMQDGEAA